MNGMICLLGGYLIGSVSPSFFLGRILKKIDIRECGTGNAGAVNTYNVLGLWPSIFTALFDLSKGLLAMFFASQLGCSPLLIHFAGLAVIAGHVFPFYLGFRGGQGVATSTGILLYYLVIFLSRGWLPPKTLILLAVCVISFSFIAKVGEVVGMIVLPVLGGFIVVFSPFSQYTLFVLSVIAYIFFIEILNIIRQHILKPTSTLARQEINWRLYLRPLAVLLIIHYLHHEKRPALILVGSIALFFLLLDLTRLFFRKANVFFFKRLSPVYKKKEYKKFSSITLFLFAFFLTFLLFEKAIAVVATSFLVFGDVFSKFFGILFGRTKLFEKSFEGSLAHLNACLLSGFIILKFVSLPFPVFLLGAVVASISEALPLGLDDNFSVALLSASAMAVTQFF